MPDRFIARWRDSGASERAYYALFLTDLFGLLDTAHLNPTPAVAGPRPYTSACALAANLKQNRQSTVIRSLGVRKACAVGAYCCKPNSKANCNP